MCAASGGRYPTRTGRSIFRVPDIRGLAVAVSKRSHGKDHVSQLPSTQDTLLLKCDMDIVFFL